MKFEEFDTGKMYKTSGGQRAKIWMLDNGNEKRYCRDCKEEQIRNGETKE